MVDATRIRVRRQGVMIALAALFAGACQGPGGPTRFVYGDGAACRQAAVETPTSLEASLDPLREAFDAHSDVPRMIVLMPHMGCENGAQVLRREVLDANPGADLRLFVIWQDVVRNADHDAARRASLHLDDERVVAFYDCAGRAGRAFASGNLPVAEAREVFLFYPAGLTWPKRSARPANAPTAAPPRTENWVHQLGRVAPERFCTPEELPVAIRRTMGHLLADAAQRRERLQQRRGAAVPIAHGVSSGR